MKALADGSGLRHHSSYNHFRNDTTPFASAPRGRSGTVRASGFRGRINVGAASLIMALWGEGTIRRRAMVGCMPNVTPPYAFAPAGSSGGCRTALVWGT